MRSLSVCKEGVCVCVMYICVYQWQDCVGPEVCLAMLLPCECLGKNMGEGNCFQDIFFASSKIPPLIVTCFFPEKFCFRKLAFV